jgi:hypothetical protein
MVGYEISDQEAARTPLNPVKIVSNLVLGKPPDHSKRLTPFATKAETLGGSIGGGPGSASRLPARTRDPRMARA